MYFGTVFLKGVTDADAMLLGVDNMIAMDTFLGHVFFSKDLS